ncbi:hypothetical protein DMUE_2785 [Dictyocoela muelleri]|nr:hypothetical protein DMUE_2785 [Dictyocoela muelleri]
MFLTHPSYKKFKNTLLETIEVKGIEKGIKSVCKNCISCQNEKETHIKLTKIYYLTEVPNWYEKILIDIRGPIKCLHFKTNNSRRYFYIIAIAEFASRYTEIAILYDIKSVTICQAIRNAWFKKHSIPKLCITDNGRQFTSSTFKNLLKENNIKHILTSPHNPSSNAVIERINREIGISIRFSRNSTLKECIANIWKRLNLTVNKTTEHSPFRILLNNNHLVRKSFIREINIEK